jgi:predicted RNA binding protein YcfA (HicA-like mRNA interferase family)
MPKLPRISGADAIRALAKLGFEQVRQRGSHVVLRRMDASGVKGCVVPLHSELATGTLRGVLKQAGVSAQEFIEQL